MRYSWIPQQPMAFMIEALCTTRTGTPSLQAAVARQCVSGQASTVHGMWRVRLCAGEDVCVGRRSEWIADDQKGDLLRLGALEYWLDAGLDKVALGHRDLLAVQRL